MQKKTIPIQNIFYIFLYASDYLKIKNFWNAEIEKLPNFESLLYFLLWKKLQERIKIGLGRSYHTEAKKICGIRGRIDFPKTIRSTLLYYKKTFSRYQIFTENTKRNQIIKSTLQAGISTKTLDTGLKQSIQRILFQFINIDDTGCNVTEIQRLEINERDRSYKFMLLLCRLLASQRIPTEKEGSDLLPKIDRNELTLYNLYEKFIANFYKQKQKEGKLKENWNIKAQKPLKWSIDKDSDYLPIMKPDLHFETSKSSKKKTKIILDTKFSDILKENQSNLKFNSSHIYQIYAYLKTQKKENDEERIGILLHPVVGEKNISEKRNVQGDTILWQTIDLAQDWNKIDSDLCEIINSLVNNDQ